MTGSPEYHVLTKAGDATQEVEVAVRELGPPERSGLHRFFFVARANQTVVMTVDSESPLANLLRVRAGWMEPGSPGPPVPPGSR